MITGTYLSPVLGVVEYFHNHGLTKGDYLIVEDTNKFMWDSWSDNWEDDKEEYGKRKAKNG